MERVLIGCRSAKVEVMALVPVLAEVVALVQQSGTLTPSLPPTLQAQLPPEEWRAVRLGWSDRLRAYPLPAGSARFLHVLDAGAQELRVWYDREDEAVVRSLGYALHNLPSFLRELSRFRAEWYEHSFRAVARHWFVLSADFQEAVCDMVGLSPSQVRRAVASRGMETQRLFVRVRLEVDAVFLPPTERGRASVPNIAGGSYSAHLVVQSPAVRQAMVREGNTIQEDYLGVSFVAGPSRYCAGETARFTIEFLYLPQLSYNALQPGATFTIRAGPRVVGYGTVA